MEEGEIGVSEGLVNRGATVGVESEHLVDKVDALGRNGREKRAEVGSLLLGEGPEVSLRLLGCEEAHVLLVRCASDARDEAQLLDVVLAGEEGLPSQDLRQDAPG